MHWLVMYGLGVATAAVAKKFGPSIAEAARPAIRNTLKGTLVMSREVQRITEEARASLGDLAAEARDELDVSEKIDGKRASR
jgi:hypothetical protein